MEKPIRVTREVITPSALADIQRETGLGDDSFASCLGITRAQLLRHKHGAPVTGALRSLLILVRQDPKGAVAEIGRAVKVGAAA